MSKCVYIPLLCVRMNPSHIFHELVMSIRWVTHDKQGEQICCLVENKIWYLVFYVFSNHSCSQTIGICFDYSTYVFIFRYLFYVFDISLYFIYINFNIISKHYYPNIFIASGICLTISDAMIESSHKLFDARSPANEWM